MNRSECQSARPRTGTEDDSDADRQRRMKRVNPRYVLRNWMAESAIRKAEKNDFSEVEETGESLVTLLCDIGPQVQVLQQVLRQPFQEQEAAERAGYASRPPGWAQSLSVSCSS
ncbi:hypothetical protein JZ751_022010 [Albula glossodonta]|uniref:Selenoprotein O n=1 Tax=Albula glossodonta TaxID=121402 RepID=A0A8T2NRA8_9TELE|nr:hypothetical protein JZ751_022010 [Albula glossodonta]